MIVDKKLQEILMYAAGGLILGFLIARHSIERTENYFVLQAIEPTEGTTETLKAVKKKALKK